jgi:hypothetical protein
MRYKTLLIAVCFLLLAGLPRRVEVVYQGPIVGLALDKELHAQVVPDGYIVVGNAEVVKVDEKHQIAWQFKPRSKGQHGISSYFHTGGGGLIIGGWEKSGHGKQAWLINLSNSGQKLWDVPVSQSEQVLAISGSSKGGFYLLTIDASVKGSSGRRVKFYDGSGSMRRSISMEIATDFAEDVSMFIRADSTVTIFGGTARNTLEVERLSLGKGNSLNQQLTIEQEAFYRNLKGFVNFAALENPAGGYYAAYSAKGRDAHEDYRLLSYDDQLKLRSTRDFGGDDSDGLSSMIIDKSGNLVLAGYSYSGVSRDKSEPAFEKNHCDVWMIKVDPKGTKLWDKTLTGPGCILQARVFNKGDQTWVVYGEESQVMVAALRD